MACVAPMGEEATMPGAAVGRASLPGGGGGHLNRLGGTGPRRPACGGDCTCRGGGPSGHTCPGSGKVCCSQPEHGGHGQMSDQRGRQGPDGDGLSVVGCGVYVLLQELLKGGGGALQLGCTGAHTACCPSSVPASSRL